MPFFRKKPVVIDANQWDGSEESGRYVAEWVRAKGGYATYNKGTNGDGNWTVPPYIAISTLEGTMLAKPSDWIIQGVAGEFYPCDDGIFQQTYEPLVDRQN